ncbi:MAG: endonuclease/exonuclease/phosphatase family protein [Bacteroidales bacterium]
MKKIFLNLIFLLSIHLIMNGQEYKFLTYNIRYDDQKNTETSWSQRKEMLTAQLRFFDPDIFGTQEGLLNQLKDIDSVLVNHSFVGAGRDDGKVKGEHSAIFYNTKKFKMMKNLTFWLSPTPDVVSMGWGSKFNRICTCALFETVESNKRIWVFNVHFDHQAELARENSAKLVIEKIKTLNPDNYPVILMGDFNTEPNTLPIQYIAGFLNDSRAVSIQPPFGNEGTFNGFEFNKPLKSRIDYIFISKDNIKVMKYAVLSDSKNCLYPSDHLPVYVEIKISENQ